MSDSITPTTVIAVTANGVSRRDDQLAVEEPLEIRLHFYQGGELQRQSIAITMRTPGSDIELARGFLVGEGIVHSAADIQSCEFSGTRALQGYDSNVVKVTLAPSVTVDLDRLQRHFYTSSSCGICGKASLEALELVGATAIPDDRFRISTAAIHRLADNISSGQSLFRETGGLHAAGLFDCDGNISELREDFGRHNAMDKIVGKLQQEDMLPAVSTGVFVSGRASFELMQKAIMAGLPLLAAVGAPSSLAVELARDYNMSLIGFMRDGRFNIYAGEQRLDIQ
jgi:FdhD protein